MDHHPPAPTGHNEIAQGRAKRHPGCVGYDVDVGARPLCVHRALVSPWDRSALSGPGLFRAHESQGGASLCPGLSPCAPLGLRTLGHRQPRESTDGYNFVE